MKRTPVVLVVAALALSACTDQPAPREPATSGGPSESHDSETVLTNAFIASSIAEILEHPAPDELPTASDAFEAFTALVLPDQGEQAECRSIAEIRPETAGFGQATADSDETVGAMQTLAAFGFHSVDTAETFTTELQDVVATCSALDATVEPLTHHTDEAFEIYVERSGDIAASLVFLRDEDTVFVASSIPPTDVALSLTLADQLQELLR